MKPYSTDLRQKVVAAYDKRQGSQREVAKLFGVSFSFVKAMLKRRRETGHVQPKVPVRKGAVPKLEGAGLAQLAELDTAQPDATLEELAERLAKQGYQVSVPTVWRALQKLNRTRKKRSPRQRAGH